MSAPTQYLPLVPHHIDHIKYVKSQSKSHNMTFVGGSLFPNDGARIFVESESKDQVESFVQNDPLYKNGLVVNYDIEEVEVMGTKSLKDISNLLEYRAI